MSQAEIAHIEVGGRSIGYRLRSGSSPTLLFLPGYASDMEGAKALALDAFAELRCLSMLRFADGAAAEAAGLSRGFWESGQQLLLLDKEMAIDCPVRLLHGEHDADVPLDVAFRTLRALRSSDVQLNVLKGGGHRLSEPREIDAILRTVASLQEPLS